MISNDTFAAVLPENKVLLRQDFSYTFSQAIWGGDSETIDLEGTDSGKATQKFYETGLSFFYGIGKDLQISSRISFAWSRMRDGTFSDANADDGQSNLNQAFLKLTKSFSPKFDFHISYKHPIWASVRSPVFLSLNDFSHDTALGATYSEVLGKNMSLHIMGEYILRSGRPADQFQLSSSLPLKYFSRFIVTPGLHWLHTFNGLGIDSPSFDAEELKTGLPPYHLKREGFLSASITGAYILSRHQWLEVSFVRKLAGYNSNKGTTLTTAFNILY